MGQRAKDLVRAPAHERPACEPRAEHDQARQDKSEHKAGMQGASFGGERGRGWGRDKPGASRGVRRAPTAMGRHPSTHADHHQSLRTRCCQLVLAPGSEGALRLCPIWVIRHGHTTPPPRVPGPFPELRARSGHPGLT